MRRLFAIVAQNPKSDRNIEEPLIGTKSYEVLKSWLRAAGISEDEVHLFNSVDQVGAITKSLAVNQAISNKCLAMKISGYKYVVSLGKIAEQAVAASKDSFPLEMDMDHSTHFNLPHPSGLNRQLNDPAAHEEAVLVLKKVKDLAKRWRSNESS